MIKWLLECFTPCGRWNAVYLINFLKEISMNEKLQWNGRRLIERTPAPPSVECGTHEYRNEKSEKNCFVRLRWSEARSASSGNIPSRNNSSNNRRADGSRVALGSPERIETRDRLIDEIFFGSKNKKKTREIHLNINILHQMGNNCFSEDSSCWFF